MKDNGRNDRIRDDIDISEHQTDREKPLEPGAELLTFKNKMSAFLVNPGVMISLSVFLTLTVLNLFPIAQ